ncbi:MAG: hypothetical protein EOO27_43585 [Comamonadaceae bacterium]|nr:MAG: hypothetical protein EOO27_43585 [Comamonadaceae bacterium]
MNEADDPVHRINREDAPTSTRSDDAEPASASSLNGNETELVESSQLSSPWPSVVGPCYTAPGIGKSTGMTATEVATATAQLELLALTTSNDVVLYPTFQVVDGAVVVGLGVVLRTLRTGTDSSLMWAQWLRLSPPPNEDRATRPSHIERLITGDVDGVVLAASHTANALRA